MDTITVKKHTTAFNQQPAESVQLVTSEINWLLDSPTLLQKSAHPALLETSPANDITSIDRASLLTNIHLFYDLLRQRKSTRLGIRYETMWQYVTRLIPSRTFLGSNIQVRGISKTLGEFDLLYYCHQRQQYVHQELAVKFYLGRPGSQGNWNDWLGPDHSDQLGKKLDRMLHQQINLASTSEGEKLLCNLTGKTDPQHWVSEVLIQGYLFYPWQRRCKAPAFSNPNHCHGDWLPFKKLDSYCKEIKAGTFTIPSRHQWLALQGILPAGHITGLAQLSDPLQSLLSRTRRPVLVIAHSEAGNVPFFVTPDCWL